MKEITKKWIEFAKADLEAARVQLRYGPKRSSAYQVAIFHCHQAVEKILKAHLVEQDQEVKKSHDLTALRVSTGLFIPEHIQQHIDELQPHYLIPRYPDFPFMPEFSFRYNRSNARTILDHTQTIVLWLEHAFKQKQ